MKNKIFATALLFTAAGSLGILAQTVVTSSPKEMKVEFKKDAQLPKGNRAMNPYSSGGSGISSRAGESTCSALNEDFQSWDGSDISWLPDGWTRENKTLPSGNPGWRMYTPAGFYDEISSTCLVVPQYTQPIDTWVITPEMSVEKGMKLSFLTHPTPVYYFDEDFIDWSRYEFEEMHIVNDFRVYVSQDGGKNWNLLKSVASDFENITNYFDLYDRTKETTYTLDLSPYAGKNIKIGFNVWGVKEGNTAMLDEVSVGFPALDISYGRPDGSLYFGLTSTDQCLPVSIVTVPVYSPVKFTNTSKDRTANFSWTYSTVEGEQTTDGTKDLTVTYTPDYSDEFTTVNNLYDMPVLKGSAENHATTEFSIPALLQAGGKGEYEAKYADSNKTELLEFGLSVVDPLIDGTATYADFAVPYFGYNEASDWYWTTQMLNGDTNYTMDENTYCHLESYGNLFFATDEPLVISGVRTNGYGILSKDAKLKAEIYLIGNDWVVPEKPYATAICTGEDITIIDRLLTNYILSFNFEFDEPIVMSKKLSPYYFVTISGFRDEKNVEYFSPEMSAIDNADKLGLGWVGLDIKFEGNVSPRSWSPVYNWIERYVSFYIMLDAAFPWLEPASDTVVIGDDGKGVLALDSYYPADEITVEDLPAWLSVTGSGRYGETVLEFTSTGSDSDSAVVTVCAPGFAKQVRVGGKAGIGSIIDIEGNGPVEIYNLSGIRVKGELTPGVYIFKMGDGSTMKKIIR